MSPNTFYSENKIHKTMVLQSIQKNFQNLIFEKILTYNFKSLKINSSEIYAHGECRDGSFLSG